MWGGRKGAIVVALVGISVAGSAAYAQDSAGNVRGVPDELRVSAGALFAASSELQDEGSDSWGLLNITYDLRRPSPSRLIDFSFFFDAAFYSDKDITYRDYYRESYNNFDRAFFGLGLQARVRLTPPTQKFGVYATGGVGLYNVTRSTSSSIRYIYDGYYDDDGNYQDGDETYTRSRSTRNGYGLGFKFGAGVSFGRGLSVEANYFNAGKLDDIRYSGYGITFGVRL